MSDPENNPSDFIQMAFTGEGDLTEEEKQYAKDMAAAFEGEVLDIYWSVQQESVASQDSPEGL